MIELLEFCTEKGFTSLGKRALKRRNILSTVSKADKKLGQVGLEPTTTGL